MNTELMILEIAVVALGLVLLLADLWTPVQHKRKLGCIAAAGLTAILIGSLFLEGAEPRFAFSNMYVLDGLALFFKRFFLLAGILVLLMMVEFSERIESGIAEYYSLSVFALAGMMWAASANDLLMMFVALELITITFYVLNSFQRRLMRSLESGVKYLILGALSTAFVVFGIALVFGTANTTSFNAIAAAAGDLAGKPVFLLGLLLILVGLGFKIAAFPFQIWVPDVYEGAPAPSVAFLAVGSKAAGFVLVLRVLFGVVPEVTVQWDKLLMLVAGITILYGNLCAIPQRNLKRLLGYSSIAHAGYILLGIAALNVAGATAVLYYLGAYLFTVIAAFTVLCVITRHQDSEDISVLAGLSRRSPLLAATMTLSMVSLAGIPPLAGFFGKFLLFKSVVEQGAINAAYYWLLAIAVIGVVISLYYYFGVVRVIYWSKTPVDAAPIPVSVLTQISLAVCVAGILYLGLLPNALVNVSRQAVRALGF